MSGPPVGLGEAFNAAIRQLQQLQQAYTEGSGDQSDPNALHEALKNQMELIATLNTTLQQTLAPSYANNVQSNVFNPLAPMREMFDRRQGNIEGVTQQANADDLKVANDVGAPESQGLGLNEGGNASKDNVESHVAGKDGVKSPCGGAKGYTFPMFFGSPKEQRTPDARPAAHESHHTIQVPARQQRSNSQVPRGVHGPEKQLSFLLPETPVDPLKKHVGYSGDVQVEAAEAAEVAAALTAMTPGGGKSKLHADDSGVGTIPQSTPGKVASTPMAIEVLSQLFSHSQQASQPQPQSFQPKASIPARQAPERKDWLPFGDDYNLNDDEYQDGEEFEASAGPWRGTKTSKPKAAKRRPSKPRSSVKEKAARAASLAVSRPKKAAVEVGKTCNCKKSQCLKMYCDCFAASGYCHPSCTCESCRNTDENEDAVNMARAAILLKNPSAFDEKVDEGAHRKGCRCKRSKCLKKYCECYQAGVPCNESCQCIGCANCEGDSMKLGDPTESVPAPQPTTSVQPLQTVEPLLPLQPLHALQQVAVPVTSLSIGGDQLSKQSPPSQPLQASQPSQTSKQPIQNLQIPYQMMAMPMKMPDGSTQVMAVPMQLNASTMQALQMGPGGVGTLGEKLSAGQDNRSVPYAIVGDIPSIDGENTTTPRSTQDSATRNLPLNKVLTDKNTLVGSNTASQQMLSQQFPSQPQDDSHPSHLQSQTPQTDTDAPSPAPQPPGASKARRMTNISDGTMGTPDWRQFSTVKSQTLPRSEQGIGKENKRPRRAASSGVAAAAAAAKHGVSHDRVGFEQKWDTITPPCRMKRKSKSVTNPLAAKENCHYSVKDVFAYHVGPVNVHARNFPKKLETETLLREALEKHKEFKTKEEEVDAASTLSSLRQ